MENFPPNSKASRAQEREPVQRVTVAQGRRQRRSLGKRFRETFFGLDGRTTMEYMYDEVVIPGIRDLIHETLSSGLDRAFYGIAGRRRGAPPSSGYGRTNYGGYWSQPNDRPPTANRRALSREARARYNFDEVILETRQDAEDARQELYNMLGQYEEVSVADLLGIVGIRAEHTDKTWGWTDLSGLQIGRVRGGGYLLDLPKPEYLR